MTTPAPAPGRAEEVSRASWRWCARALTSFAIAALLLACSRGDSHARSFAGALRCGMTKDEVRRVAREEHYDGADAGWMSRAVARSPRQPQVLIDLTFRAGALVAYREGVWVPAQRRIVYTTVELCRSSR